MRGLEAQRAQGREATAGSYTVQVMVIGETAACTCRLYILLLKCASRVGFGGRSPPPRPAHSRPHTPIPPPTHAFATNAAGHMSSSTAWGWDALCLAVTHTSCSVPVVCVPTSLHRTAVHGGAVRRSLPPLLSPPTHASTYAQQIAHGGMCAIHSFLTSHPFPVAKHTRTCTRTARTHMT